MKRKEEKYLESWLNNKNRKPLIIRGARQVGKSTLVKLFAKSKKLKLIEINFEENYQYKKIFSQNDISFIITSLEIEIGENIDLDNSILFLDEIQEHPEAIAILRYFYEKLPSLPVIAAGSLLEFVLAKHSFSMPVGRIEYLYMGPMTFNEYLVANGENQLVEYLNTYSLKNIIPEAIHDKALTHLKNYFLIGGMPEAVKIFVENHSLIDVDRIKHSILNTFRDDFNKYSNRQDPVNLQEIFDRLGVIVGKKIVYNTLLSDEKSYKIKNILSIFEKARLFYRVYHSSANGLPIKAEVNKKTSKGIFLDIGLLLSLNGLSLASLYKDTNLFFSNRGELAEQFIGQHLLYRKNKYMPPEVYYWNREKSQSNAEIDYLIQKGNNILPIEVKSGKTGTLKSLHLFMEHKKLKHAVRFSTGQPVIEKINSSLSISKYSYNLISLPLYLVDQLDRLLADAI